MLFCMRTIIRYMLAVCFLLSGLLKIFSLRAFEQEVQLYGDAYIGEWIRDFSFEIAVLVCAMEIIAAVIALLRKLPMLTGIVFVVLLSLFVYLTDINLFFPSITGSIETCGCFGEFIHFTPLASFLKSVTLITMAIIYLCLILPHRTIKSGEEGGRLYV